MLLWFESNALWIWQVGFQFTFVVALASKLDMVSGSVGQTFLFFHDLILSIVSCLKFTMDGNLQAIECGGDYFLVGF